MNTARRRAVLLVFAAALVVSACYPILRFMHAGRPLPFDAAEWQSFDISAKGLVDDFFALPSIRARMVDDLLTNHVKAGSTVNELHELLGRPSEIVPGSGRSLWYYWIDILPQGERDYDVSLLSVEVVDEHVGKTTLEKW